MVVADLRYRHGGRQLCHQTQARGRVDRVGIRMHGTAGRRALAAVETADFLGRDLGGTVFDPSMDLLVGQDVGASSARPEAERRSALQVNGMSAN